MRMTIRKKLVGGFLIVLTISAIGSIVGLLGVKQINKKVHSATYEYWPTADAAMEMWIGSLTDIQGTREYLSGEEKNVDLVKQGEKVYNEAFEALEKTGLVDAKEIGEIHTLNSRYNAIKQEAYKAYEVQVLKTQELHDTIDLLHKKLAEVDDKTDAQMQNLVTSGNAEVDVINKYWETADAAMDMRIGSLTDIQGTREYLSGEENNMDLAKQGKKFYDEAFEVLEKTGLVDAKAIGEIRTLNSRYNALKQEAYKAYETKVVKMQELHSTIDLLHMKLAKLEKKMDDKMDEVAIASVRTANTSYGVMIISSLVCIICGISVGFIISRGITYPLQKLVTVTGIIAKGDFSQRAEIASKDEIGDLATSFNHMTDEIQKRNEELQTMNEELRSTNEELETSNEELRSTTEELEASNEELRSTTEELETSNEDLRSTTEELETSNEDLRSSTEELETSNEDLRSTTEEIEASNEELRITNEDLEATQEKLVQQEKLAAVGQLASGIGHELRNPLGVIKNATYYIKTKIGTEDPKLVKHLNIMEREVNNSNKIISDLLGFSRTRPPSIAASDINKIVEQALEVVERPEKVFLVKDLETKLPKAMVDASQMHQVFVNLALNAVQAMADGGELKITTRDKKEFIEVEISDTGCGIPQENIQKLFDPFFTTKARGIGLGLAVTYGIIEKNKGDIEVKSKVGEGTTFLLRMPVEKQTTKSPEVDKQEISVS